MLFAMLNVVTSAKPPWGIATTTILLRESDLQLIKDFFFFPFLI